MLFLVTADGFKVREPKSFNLQIFGYHLPYGMGLWVLCPVSGGSMKMLLIIVLLIEIHGINFSHIRYLWCDAIFTLSIHKWPFCPSNIL